MRFLVVFVLLVLLCAGCAVEPEPLVDETHSIYNCEQAYEEGIFDYDAGR